MLLLQLDLPTCWMKYVVNYLEPHSYHPQLRKHISMNSCVIFRGLDVLTVVGSCCCHDYKIANLFQYFAGGVPGRARGRAMTSAALAANWPVTNKEVC
jgi:hypothetical protein